MNHSSQAFEKYFNQQIYHASLSHKICENKVVKVKLDTGKVIIVGKLFFKYYLFGQIHVELIISLSRNLS